ncbi:HNH endonuclease [Anabaena lutea]|uniref:HNH endonuclease n=1 Tax=Anabaena lutea FACHB-196 TaxID=2692881 RepID=A0ABR8FI19_9NOST|nr:HNH endonuclease signature motif containing protein [Anabaena lutea]MBD2569743.1 HNH endonuclease [Anabaena lutea FACHB-196]
MDRPYLNKELRRLVANRADYLCEYCLIQEEDTVLGCTVDHIISIKHGGSSNEDNLAYCCVFCNRFKGSNIGSILWETKEFVRFYNPRWDNWGQHFKINDFRIESITSIGEVTARILGFNDQPRLLERQILISKKRYPSPLALKRINL